MTVLDVLPEPNDRAGEPRRVGIEVECGGLPEDRVAELVAEELGGAPRRTGGYVWEVPGGELGRVEVLLDTAMRDRVQGDVGRAGLDLGRAVIPVEFVTQPILPEQIPRIDALCRRLAAAGATGTQDGIALGFGVHLNVALAGLDLDGIQPVLTAFALVEDWMRARMRLDPSRRLLPFVDTYPTVLLDRLCDPETTWTLARLMSAYLETAPTRNHALDVLPILKQIDAARVVDAVPAMKTKSARPAWHYRLPDCRIDQEGWSVALEWNRWCWVERVAADPVLMQRLVTAWRDYRRRRIPVPGQWAGTSAEILDQEGTFP